MTEAADRLASHRRGRRTRRSQRPNLAGSPQAFGGVRHTFVTNLPSRVCARSIPLLLILDEPTSALDAHAEHVLFERYAESARAVARATGGIAIFVSHRFSTVRMADRIVVVDGGRIVEQGSRDELVALGRIYAELFALQAAAYG